MDLLHPLVDMLFVSTDPDEVAVSIPLVLEFIAVLAGAVSGAVTASNLKLDLIGACVLAMVTSLGGGLVRDMILSNHSVYMLDYPAAVICCMVVGVLAFFCARFFTVFERPFAFFDILGVALFTLVGADKALMAGYGLVPGVLLGVLTSVGGGVIRDVIIGRVPAIFQASNFYAVCSLVGAAVYCMMVEGHIAKDLAAVVCIVVVIGLRYLSLHYNLQTGTPVDLLEKISHRAGPDEDCNR